MPHMFVLWFKVFGRRHKLPLPPPYLAHEGLVVYGMEECSFFLRQSKTLGLEELFSSLCVGSDGVSSILPKARGTMIVGPLEALQLRVSRKHPSLSIRGKTIVGPMEALQLGVS